MAKPKDAMHWVEAMERRDADFKRRVEEELAAMHLEQQLVELREARGLSQAQLGRAISVTQQAIAKAESGQTKNPELRTLIKHVLALGGQLEVRIRPRAGIARPKTPAAARPKAARPRRAAAG